MDIPVTISHRRVRHIRLEYGLSGLHIIVPVGFDGDINDVIARHKPWIIKRQKQIAAAQEQSLTLPVLNRTAQLLRLVIQQCVTESSVAIGAVPQVVRYRVMKSRWGSCTESGIVTFNTKLKYLPDELVAYVVHHEITHLRVMRHNQQFWQYMQQRFPNYKQLEEQLRVYGMMLHTQ